MNTPENNLGLNASLVIRLGVILVTTIILIVGVLYAWNLKLRADKTKVLATHSPRHQLEFESGELRFAKESAQKMEMRSYHWKDSQHHFASVPISRAMQIYLEGENK